MAQTLARPATMSGPRWWRDERHLPWWRIPLYPTVIPCSFVLLVWGYARLPPSQLVRPLSVAFTLTLVVTLLLAALFADRERAGLAATAAALLVITTDERVALLAGIVVIAIVVEGLVHRGRQAIVAGIATRLLNVVSAVLLVVVGLGLARVGAISQAIEDLAMTGLPGLGPIAADRPDMFLILLDAYPGDRAARLATSFDADAFPAALRDRGFDVVHDAHSNYLLTPLTLTSMLSMRHLADIPSLDAPYGSAVADWRRLRAVLDDAPAFAELRASGYRVTVVDGGYGHVQLPRVDRFIPQPGPGEFELVLIRNTGLQRILDAASPGTMAGLARDRITTVFREARQVATEPRSGPQFVFIHVPAPHPPWVFYGNGAPRNPVDVTFAGEPASSAQEALDAGFEQARYVGGLTLDLVDDIRASSSTPPVIVVMSDHGPATDFSTEAPFSGNYEVRASNLMAAATPGHPGLIGDHLTPINLFPTLLDAYVGGSRPRQPDTIWGWRGSYLDVIPAPPIPGWTQ